MNFDSFKTKLSITIIILILANLFSYAQSPVGAWERYYNDENGNTIRSVVIFSEKFQSIAMFMQSQVNLYIQTVEHGN